MTEKEKLEYFKMALRDWMGEINTFAEFREFLQLITVKRLINDVRLNIEKQIKESKIKELDVFKIKELDVFNQELEIL